jgi:hypothetical protein
MNPMIDIDRPHGFAPAKHVPQWCVRCAEKVNHPVHVLHGRKFPQMGDRVRVLSVPERCQSVRIGDEALVVDYFGARQSGIVTIQCKGFFFWWAARALLVLS